MKAILATLILSVAVGCTERNDKQETQTIDICTDCEPATEEPVEKEPGKEPVAVEGERNQNHFEGGFIMEVIPASNAEGVQLETEISIVFKGDIDPSELTSAHFYMTNSRGEEIETKLVYDKRKATLTPVNKLNLLTTYNLTLKGAKTLSGRQVDEKMWTFTTRDGAWGNPHALQIETRKESFGGKIVADQHGNAAAIWPQYQNFRAQIWEARYETDRGWLPSHALEQHGADYSSLDFKLAMDAGGQAAASWILHWGIGRTAFNFMGAGGVWGEANILGEKGIIKQDIAMGDNDQTLISSITEGDNAEVFLVMFDSRSRELFSFEVIPCNSTCYYTEGIFDDQGNAYAVVERSRNGQYSEVLVGAFDGEHWGISVIKDAGAGDSADPRLAISKGTPVVFWSQWGEDAGVWIRKFQDGRWLAEERISANEATKNLKVESNISGDMVATWTQRDERYLYANVYIAGSGEWTGPRRIDSGEGDLYAPGVVIDGEGNVTIVWAQKKDYDPVNSLYAARYDSGRGKWMEGKRIREIYLAQTNAPSLTSLSDGRLLLLTTQFETNWNTVVLEFK